MKQVLIMSYFCTLFTFVACIGAKTKSKPSEYSYTLDLTDTATFAAGCFWCVEAVFQELEGVIFVESGYSNGKTQVPNYEEVCSGTTGYAEAVRIIYDPKKISYSELLEVFWATHDPTTLNRQGSDIGTQYRSAIFYHNKEQKLLAEKYKKILTNENVFSNPILTEITSAAKFYKAEEYHQNYYNMNQNKSYCSVFIRPKLEKLEKLFKEKIKKK